MKNKKAIISKFVFFSKLIFISSVISWCECSGGLWVVALNWCPWCRSLSSAWDAPTSLLPPGVSYHTCPIVVYLLWVLHIFYKNGFKVQDLPVAVCK